MNEYNVEQAICKCLAYYRNKTGKTQEQISGLAGIPRSHLAAIENGTKIPTVKTLVKIFNALSINISEFFRTVESELNNH